MSHKLAAIVNLAFALIALFATVLGGMVLAFDKTLWPIDGYVLYVGQTFHIACLCTSTASVAIAAIGPSAVLASRYWGLLSAAVACVAIATSWMSYDAFFVYGFPISPG